MTEFLDNLTHQHEHPALFDERAVLENLQPQAILDFKEECLAKISHLEKYVNMANEVLDGYGVEPAL